MSAAEFAALSAALASAPIAPVRHAALLQYSRAAAASAQGAPAAVHWELLQREERQLSLAASEGASGNNHLVDRRPQEAWGVIHLLYTLAFPAWTRMHSCPVVSRGEPGEGKTTMSGLGHRLRILR